MSCKKNGFNLCPVTYNEVLKELGELRNDTSTGPDNLPVKFIKHCADNLASPITHILNSCIDLQLFPSPWKI